MRTALSTLAAASLLLAGCGGTGGDASLATSPPSDTAGVTESSPRPEDLPANTTPPGTATPRETTPTPEPQESTRTTPPAGDDAMDTTTPPSDDPAAGLVDNAVADLASRLKVPAATIEVLRAEQVTWPDGSLGCPEPSKAYTQATVDGYRVILQHDGRIFLYHAGGEGPIFLCPSDEKDGGYDFVPPPGFHD